MGMAKRMYEEIMERDYGFADWNICVSHVTDEALLQSLKGKKSTGSCSFCDDANSEENQVIEAEVFMETFMKTFKYFCANAEIYGIWITELGGYLDSTIDTESAVWRLAENAFDEQHQVEILEAISEVIGTDKEWCDYYYSDDSEEFSLAWEQFSTKVKHGFRFFMNSNSSDGEDDFVTVGFLKQISYYASAELNMVKVLETGTSFYRGRLYGKDIPENTHKALGPPPSSLASANRMSPEGISLFYASSNPQTAISEIAAHGIDQNAVVGEFRNLREISVLDLTAIPKVPSPFNNELREQARMVQFLAYFVAKVTQPVLPDDKYHIEYVPTQVITEYFRKNFSSEIDGIVFPSSHDSESNYVFFYGPEYFSTKGIVNDKNTDRKSSNRGQKIQPIFELIPENTEIYTVERKYSGVLKKSDQNIIGGIFLDS